MRCVWMIYARNWSKSIQKRRERLISKIADASFVLSRFVSSPENLLLRSASNGLATQATQGAAVSSPPLGRSGDRPFLKQCRQDCLQHRQASSSFATGKSFTNESIDVWK